MNFSWLASIFFAIFSETEGALVKLLAEKSVFSVNNQAIIQIPGSIAFPLINAFFY